MIEQVSPFHAATIAFAIRFEQDLTSRWQHLECEVASAAIGAPSAKKHSLLYGFFDDATEEIGRVIHEYCPKLLQIATTHREQLGNQSPLSWTQAQVLTQVCNFLGMEEKFDQTSPPRDDSRALNSAARIADAGVECLDEAGPGDFLLPGWGDSPWLLSVGLRFKEGSGDDCEPKAPLSRADTLEWVKHREFWLSKKVEQQLENEGWDGIIEASKTGSDVLEAVGETGIVAALPSKKGAVRSKVAKEPPKEKLVFTRRNGKSLIKGKFTHVALWKTLETFTGTLAQFRTAVRNAKDRVSISEMKKNVGGSELAKTADDADWENWVEIFATKPPATAKAAALVFLEKKTGLNRSTIVKYCSNARNTTK